MRRGGDGWRESRQGRDGLRSPVNAYAGGLMILLILLAGFYILQERRRPMPAAGSVAARQQT